jgi:hypothetical protein
MPSEMEVAADAVVAVWMHLVRKGAPRTKAFLLELGNASGVSAKALEVAYHRAADHRSTRPTERLVTSQEYADEPLVKTLEEKIGLGNLPWGCSYVKNSGKVYARMEVLPTSVGDCTRCGSPIFPRSRSGIGRKWCIFCRFLI